jgi:hypothetical protein
MTRQHASDALDEEGAREWWDVFISHATEEKAVGRLFLDLLEKTSDPAEVRRFLWRHPSIVLTAVGGNEMSLVRWTPALGHLTPDLCVSMSCLTGL